jgi:acyl carrier protein phosphodiesterase
MNFLAHVFLSGDSEELIIGNFIADAIRGDYSEYPPGIIKGIELHRKIDHYTDSHAAVDQSINRLKPIYGRYSSVIVDIFYDHYLAKDWKKYSDVPLNQYAANIYQIMSDNLDHMPPKVHQFLPYMISGNWLVNYANFDGIESTLQGMSRRAKFESGMEKSIEDLKKDHELYQKEFDEFFPQLQEYVNTVI